MAVCCPCCGQKCESFQPFGVYPRPNRQCPKCGSLERHRGLYLYLKQETAIFSRPGRLLHFAPEPILARQLQNVPELDYVTTDLVGKRVSVRMDITDILFRADTFDWILCSHVLEHIPDDRKAIRELRRVLKPDGFALILVPFRTGLAMTFDDSSIVTPEDRERVFGQKDHVRNIGRDYLDRLVEAGLAVKEIDYAAAIGASRARYYGMQPNQPIYVCTKNSK